MAIYYIKGVGVDSAQIIWVVNNYWFRNPPARETFTYTSGSIFSGNCLLNKELKKTYVANEIHPKLTVKAGETKIIVDVCLYWDSAAFKKPSGVKFGLAKPSSWGFLIFNPRHDAASNDNTKLGYFHTIAIFTPKSELFDENPPK
jgi:hypothetical protein